MKWLNIVKENHRVTGGHVTDFKDHLEWRQESLIVSLYSLLQGFLFCTLISNRSADQIFIGWSYARRK